MIRQNVERILRRQIGDLSDLAAQALLETDDHETDEAAVSAMATMLEAVEKAASAIWPNRGAIGAVTQLKEYDDDSDRVVENYRQAHDRIKKLRILHGPGAE